MTLSAHGVPLERQRWVWSMRIPEGNAAARRTAAGPSALQGPVGRSGFDFFLIEVCHPYRKFLSTTLLSVLGPEKLRGVSQGPPDAGIDRRIETSASKTSGGTLRIMESNIAERADNRAAHGRGRIWTDDPWGVSSQRPVFATHHNKLESHRNIKHDRGTPEPPVKPVRLSSRFVTSYHLISHP